MKVVWIWCFNFWITLQHIQTKLSPKVHVHYFLRYDYFSLSIWFCAINFLDDFSHLGQVLPSKCGKVSGHIRISTCKIVSLTHIYKCFICQAYFLPFCSVGFRFELLSRNVTKANVKIKSIITQQYVLAQVYYWTYQIGPPVFKLGVLMFWIMHVLCLIYGRCNCSWQVVMQTRMQSCKVAD